MANDLVLGSPASPARSLLLTGPNMGGKSTCATLTAHQTLQCLWLARLSAPAGPKTLVVMLHMSKLSGRLLLRNLEALRKLWCRLLRASCTAVIMAQVGPKLPVNGFATCSVAVCLPAWTVQSGESNWQHVRYAAFGPLAGQ